jgi:hypothetical protein
MVKSAATFLLCMAPGPMDPPLLAKNMRVIAVQLP